MSQTARPPRKEQWRQRPATKDSPLIRHLPVRRRERKKKRGRKDTNATSFCHPLPTFAENPQLRIRFLPRPFRCNKGSTSQMCENPRAIITVLIKTVKIHYVLKGSHENPWTRSTKKSHNNKSTLPGTFGF